ncbi:metal-dependent hydrolases of the beta-lactamase superfamily III [Coriobacteriaceae bacterium EMTCatB1]|nr:metal-dependent hydrolases of the beta-lactamase superfamily III [Coriobacteriaceae bacterium EMTCatB1]
MHLTVLGSGASYPGAGRACAGYLVTTGAARLLLDCGNGSVSNLARVVAPEDLSAVFVTHGHLDHFADLYVLQAALRYAPQAPAPALDLFAPPGVMEAVLAPLSERGRQEMRDAFREHELSDGVSRSVSDAVVTPVSVKHAGQTYALVVESGGRRLVYTSDSVLDDRLVEAARGAHVLLADATLPDEYAGRAPHMTPSEAGRLAALAGVGTLVLTHLWPSVDRVAAARDAARAFGGRIMVASEMLAVDV